MVSFLQKKTHLNSYGFTLLELIISFSALAILSVIGIASFVRYSQAQTLNTTVFDVITTLNLAKSRALSQAIQDSNNVNMCGEDAFTGYEVRICGLPNSFCRSSSFSYELNIVCSGSNESASNPLTGSKFPTGVSIDTDSQKTTSVNFLFNAVTGGVSGAGQITINGVSGAFKIIRVDGTGNISIQ